VNIPLFWLFGRTSRINVYEHELEVRRLTEEKIAMDVSRQVILEYNNMLSTHRLLLLASKSRGTSRLLLDMADKQFAQGDITIADYTSVSAIASKAEQDYEIAKRDFYNNYQQLEKLLGVRLDTLVRKR
jgi:outer membrane protein TolC